MSSWKPWNEKHEQWKLLKGVKQFLCSARSSNYLPLPIVIQYNEWLTTGYSTFPWSNPKILQKAVTKLQTWSEGTCNPEADLYPSYLQRFSNPMYSCCSIFPIMFDIPTPPTIPMFREGSRSKGISKAKNFQMNYQRQQTLDAVKVIILSCFARRLWTQFKITHKSNLFSFSQFRTNPSISLHS